MLRINIFQYYFNFKVIEETRFSMNVVKNKRRDESLSYQLGCKFIISVEIKEKHFCLREDRFKLISAKKTEIE